MSFSNFELTDHLQVTLLALHRVSVDLAHIPSSVGFSNFPDMEKPYPMVGVGYRDSMILRDHMTVDGQDSLGVHSEPSDLYI